MCSINSNGEVFSIFFKLPFLSVAGLRALSRRDSLQRAPARLFLGFVQTFSLLVKAAGLCAAKQRGGPLRYSLNVLPQNCGDSTLLQELFSSAFLGNKGGHRMSLDKMWK